MNTKTKELTLTALMTAIICVLGPLSVPLPFSPVPISLTMIGIYLAVYAVGMWRGTVAFLVSLLLGPVSLNKKKKKKKKQKKKEGANNT